EIDGNTVETVTNFLPVLGVPFLLISWFMLVKMGFSLIDVKSKNRAIRIYLIFLAIVFVVVSGIFFLTDNFLAFITENLIYTEMGIFVGLELGYMLIFAGIVRHYSKRQKRAD